MKRRIDIDDDDVDMDVEGRLFYGGEPYSGEVAEYLRGALISLDDYVDGWPHGMQREWYANGEPRGEGVARNGLPSGEHKEWHSNGRLASKKIFSAERGELLAEYFWDEEGNSTRAWKATED
ncbi:toxin-antitoxin system YwqK family antitoxin [Streptomyces youssoufiensis]